MKKVVRLTESQLTKIVKRVIKENQTERELDLRNKLNDIFFGHDEYNMTSEPGEFGFLSQEHRLSKKISPRQRIKRIEMVINDLENYIEDLKDIAQGEDVYTQNPEYDSVWKDIEKDM
jgi:hypothetical protein